MLIERDMTEFSCLHEARALSEPAPQDRAAQLSPALQLQAHPGEHARTLSIHPEVVRKVH
ncbi:hypothetical protein Q9Q94_16715 [Uliginosibacterium sp. 31-16]|uniref:hypothetical protein n=1 Tax=Uliginosibacterium sp. 31-16 TaxID=3068315 RepID=UPI00273E3422|nr:hypothetical protein [Uliginosibacterium sp. 31-16]MDP5241184.1 hypothetical protein [Uliginosibacterium sp. 31-16]